MYRNIKYLIVVGAVGFICAACDTIPKHHSQGVCVKNYWIKDVFEIIKVDGSMMIMRNIRTNEERKESRLQGPFKDIWPEVPCPRK